MAFDNEYEFVPLTPITHNSLPNEMKDFIASCGMMGMMPTNNFINPMQRELAEVIDLKSTNEELDVEDWDEDEVDRYVEDSEKELFTEVSGENTIYSRYLEDEEEYIKTDKVLRKIENNNIGIFKFLEVNGMPYEKAKKFIRRVVRLSMRYNE
ncbi:hypothetical protein [Clostridium sp.]|uniref:hypothetical protein n=1 Tax=Clostridium sp. TaxID=1506 RepID=UPI003216A9CF